MNDLFKTLQDSFKVPSLINFSGSLQVQQQQDQKQETKEKKEFRPRKPKKKSPEEFISDSCINRIIEKSQVGRKSPSTLQSIRNEITRFLHYMFLNIWTTKSEVFLEAQKQKQQAELTKMALSSSSSSSSSSSPVVGNSLKKVVMNFSCLTGDINNALEQLCLSVDAASADAVSVGRPSTPSTEPVVLTEQDQYQDDEDEEDEGQDSPKQGDQQQEQEQQEQEQQQPEQEQQQQQEKDQEQEKEQKKPTLEKVGVKRPRTSSSCSIRSIPKLTFERLLKHVFKQVTKRADVILQLTQQMRDYILHKLEIHIQSILSRIRKLRVHPKKKTMQDADLQLLYDLQYPALLKINALLGQ